MSQLKHVVDPFGEVNVYAAGGRTRVVATILMEPEPSSAMPVCVPSRLGSIRMVATTRTLPPEDV